MKHLFKGCLIKTVTNSGRRHRRTAGTNELQKHMFWALEHTLSFTTLRAQWL